jgi:hypothetical protein
MRRAFFATSLTFAVIGLALVGLGCGMVVRQSGGGSGGGVLALIIGFGTLFVAYVFLAAARRATGAPREGGTAEPQRAATARGVGRIALTCFLLGLVGVVVPIGGLSTTLRVVLGIILALGILVGSAAAADSRNARSRGTNADARDATRDESAPKA